MSAHRAASGKWIVRWREGGRNRSKTFTRADDARRFDSEVRRRKEIGEMVLTRADVPTLEQAAVEWLASKDALSPSTERSYADLIERLILPDLGGLSLLDLRPRRLEQWQAKLLRTTTPRMVQLSRAVLSQILDKAVAHEYLPANGLKVIKAPHHEGKLIEPATAAQVEAMRGWFLDAGSQSQAAMISLLAYAGPRPPQEPMAVMWSDLEGPRLRIRRRNLGGKLTTGLKAGKRERTITLPQPVATELAELRIALGRPQGLVFPRRDGNPWTKTDWANWSRRKFAKARDYAGLPDTFTPYGLRHTCASLMLAAGRPLPEVANQLGHSIAVCATTYAHLIDSYSGQETKPMDEMIRTEREMFADCSSERVTS